MPLSPGSTSNELPMLPYDQEASREFKIQMQGLIGDIEIQFPPKITTDGKSARWDEQHLMGYEEYAIWNGAMGRNCNIELNYVVWGKWDNERIRKQINNIRLHLYVGGGLPPGDDKIPFFFVEGWQVIDGRKERVPFRMLRTSISYSREHVGSGVDWWPLHTKVDLDCKMFTRTGMVAGKGKWREKKFNGFFLPELPNVEWA